MELQDDFLSFFGSLFVSLEEEEDLLDPVSCFVGRLSILRWGTADGEPAAATAAIDNRPDAVVVAGRRDIYDAQGRLGERVRAAVGIRGDAVVAQPFALLAGWRLSRRNC